MDQHVGMLHGGTLVSVLCLGTALAAEDRRREDMQRALNEQVMATPFNAGDVKKAQVYAEEARKQGVVPTTQPPAHWVPGWTCAHLTAHPYYSYPVYQNCIYYHYYYGRYWR